MRKEMRFGIIIQLMLLLVLLTNNAFSQAQQVTGWENEYCIDSPADTIYGINPTTGTFPIVDKDGLATGVTQIGWNPAVGVFDPSKAGIHGDHAHIVYEVAGHLKEFKPKIRDNAPTASLDPLPSFFCDTDPAYSLSEGNPAGGSYLLDGTDIISEFDPGIQGPGTYSIAYITSSGVCTDTSDAQTLVVGPQAITLSAINTQYCEDEADIDFTYSPTGGTFTAIPGLTDHGDGTASFSPAASGAATRIIEYSFSEMGCTSTLTKSVIVFPLTTLNFSGLDPIGYCINDAAVILTGNQAPLGTFSGPGITDLGNGTASFDPSSLTVGGSPFTVTYTYTDGATTCTNSVSKQTNILAVPSGMISGSATICSGDAASLDVNFTGTGPFDITYTDGTSSNTVTNVIDPYVLSLSPTVSSVYTLESVRQANGCSAAGTGSGTVTVNPLTEIVTNPVNEISCTGENASFTLVATGTNLTYQWQFNGVDISLANASILNLNNIDAGDAGDYRCVISSSCSPDQTSATACLQLIPPTKITKEPSDVRTCEGSNISFNVQAIGSGLSYTWKKNGIDVTEGGNIFGSTSPTLVISDISLADVAVYKCYVNGDCGDQTTIPVTLTVDQEINIVTQPISQSVCTGGSTSFSVAVTGTFPQYQWQLDNADIPGANSPTLNLSGVNAADAGNYTCVITGDCGTKISDLVTLEVHENVSIDLQPSAISRCEGSNANFNLAASGSITGYQWRFNGVDLADGAGISGANSPNLSLSNLGPANAGGYVCIVTGECGSVSTITAGLHIDEAITLTLNPVDQSFCESDDLILSTVATGTSLEYQWYKNGVFMPGKNANTLVIPGAMATDVGSYYCEISNSCLPQTSSTANLSLDSPTTIVTQPSDDIACEGENANMVVALTGSNLSYAWTRNGTPVNDGGGYSGTRTSSLVISNLDINHGGLYVCEVSGSCGDINSNPAVLTVKENVNITSQPANQTFCPATNVQFEVHATGTNLVYQWQLDGVDILLADNNTAHNNTLLIPAATLADQGVYRCKITADCETKYSNAASLSLTNPISISSFPLNQRLCEGNNTSFSVGATGSDLIFQWKKNGTDLVNDARISGVNSSTLNIKMLTENDQAVYSCQIINACGFENSIPANLVIDELVTIITQPAVFDAVENGNASFSVAADGDILSYQWYKVSDGLPVLDGGTFSGAQTSILTLTNVHSAHADSYYCVLTGTCSTLTSEPGLLNVNLLTLITLHPVAAGDKCVGESVSFDVVASGTNLSYTWRKNGIDLIDDLKISGSASASLTIDNLQVSDAGSYSCLVRGDEGPENSFPATLNVNELTDVILQPLDGTRCEGDDALFVTGAVGNITGYRWQFNGIDLVGDGRITGSSTSTLAVASITTADMGIYHCIVSGLCASDISNAATMLVHENTSITSQPTAVSGCTGTAASFSVTTSGGGISYQWKKGGVDLVNDGRISGVNSKDLTISTIQVSDAGTYNCMVSGPCGSENSLAANLTVSPETLISTQPVDKDHCEGDDAIFSVEAEGLGLTYQWRMEGTPLVEDGVHIIGSDSETLIISELAGTDQGSYQCFVSGACDDYLSDPAALIVQPRVQIITHPLDDTKCSGQSVTLSVSSANISNGFHWKKDGVKLSSGPKFSGVNTPNLTIADLSLAEAGIYSCMVYGGCDSLNSGLANLQVKPATTVTIQPMHQNVNEGLPLTFTVEAQGDLLTYQWQKDGANIPGANSNVFTIPSATTADEGAYSCLITGTCNTCLSDPANLTVNVETHITSHPVGMTKCEGDAAVFSVTATGENLSYEWRKNGTALNDISANISGSSHTKSKHFASSIVRCCHLYMCCFRQRG